MSDLLFASEKSAARLLDMKVDQFRDLVAAGSLPPPITLGADIERWRVADIDAILTGRAMSEEFEW